MPRELIGGCAARLSRHEALRAPVRAWGFRHVREVPGRANRRPAGSCGSVRGVINAACAAASWVTLMGKAP